MSLWDPIPIVSSLDRRALAIWRRREATYPAFVRRNHPDTLDLISGAWSRVLAEAEQELARADIQIPPGIAVR